MNLVSARWRTEKTISTLFLFTIVVAHQSFSQYEEGLFYRGYSYGTQANYNPFSFILNGSFDIVQLGKGNNHILKIQYANGAANVFRNISRYPTVIEHYGVKKFFTTEVFPTSFQLSHAQYWPNYKLHLLGGGISYVGMTEWYSYHGYQYPKFLSVATMATLHFLNEVVENNEYRGETVDPIADLLIFDPAGILIFSIDGVPEFFSKTLSAADWSNQPLFQFSDRSLVNNGQNFSVKIPLPFLKQWKILYTFGMDGLVGLSYRCNETDNISVAGGLGAKELVEVENSPGMRILTTSLIKKGGIYYDRNNSLLVSVFLGNSGGYFLKANIYPGVIDIGSLPVGIVFMLLDNYKISFGISTSFSPIGIAFPVH